MDEKKKGNVLVVVLLVIILALGTVVALMFTGVIKLNSDVKCKETPAVEKKEAKESEEKKSEELEDDCIKVVSKEETDKKVEAIEAPAKVYTNADVVGKYTPDFSKTDLHYLSGFELNKNGTYNMEPTCDDGCFTGGTVMFGNYYIEGNKIVLNQIIYFDQQADDYVVSDTYEGTIKEDGTIDIYQYDGNGQKSALISMKKVDSTDRSSNFEQNVDNIVKNY